MSVLHDFGGLGFSSGLAHFQRLMTLGRIRQSPYFKPVSLVQTITDHPLNVVVIRKAMSSWTCLNQTQRGCPLNASLDVGCPRESGAMIRQCLRQQRRLLISISVLSFWLQATDASRCGRVHGMSINSFARAGSS